jgi:hypothetical protein
VGDKTCKKKNNVPLNFNGYLACQCMADRVLLSESKLENMA